MVVTIVVIIMLATVNISAVLGDNGIIKKAQQTKSMNANSVVSEEVDMNKLLEEYANMTYEPPEPAGEVVSKPPTWTSDKVTAISDGNGGTVPLPENFYYVGGDKNSGLVISDKQGDTMDASGTASGNQFVWIPVTGEADLARTNFDNNGQPTSGLDTTSNTEPYASGYSTEASEYNTMKTQVLKYGGFYIGRYEAGINSTELRTKVTTNQTVVSKKGVAPYNYVLWGKSMSDITTAFVPTSNNSDNVSTNGAVYLAKSMYASSNSVTSTLCYGSQWDAMCRYIGDSQRTTPTKSAPELTGSVSTDVSKNIYDLAGNCFEWTMEASKASGTGVRVRRGGYYGYARPVSYRYDNYTASSNGSYSFRCALYISDPES